jgi:hypothetical protein
MVSVGYLLPIPVLGRDQVSPNTYLLSSATAVHATAINYQLKTSSRQMKIKE